MGTLFTGLGVAAALSVTDIIPVHQGGARAVGLTGAQLLTLVGTAYVPLAGGTMTGALTIASGTLTASAPALSITQTWNNGSVGFTSALIDITNSASTGSSYPLLIKLGGSNLFAFSKAGELICNSVAANIDLAAFADTYIRRISAGVAGQYNGASVQAYQIYSLRTDSSNYERLTLTGVAGTSVNITAETLGTGGDNLNIVLTPAGTGQILSAASMELAGVYLGTAGLNGRFTVSGSKIRSDALAAWSSTTNVASAADAGIGRNAAGVLEVNSGTAGTLRDLLARNVRTDPVAFASLVAAATAGNGARAMITNCSHATFGTAADGGGSTKVPVYSDGTNWLVG